MQVVLLIRTSSAITLFVCTEKILEFKTHEGLLTKCSLGGRLDPTTCLFFPFENIPTPEILSKKIWRTDRQVRQNHNVARATQSWVSVVKWLLVCKLAFPSFPTPIYTHLCVLSHLFPTDMDINTKRSACFIALTKKFLHVQIMCLCACLYVKCCAYVRHYWHPILNFISVCII